MRGREQDTWRNGSKGIGEVNRREGKEEDFCIDPDLDYYFFFLL